MLQVAPSLIWEGLARRRDPARRPARARRDEELLPSIERVWRASGERYGADKVWMQLNRDGVAVARCTVERLMRQEGWRGVVRGRTVRTTIACWRPWAIGRRRKRRRTTIGNASRFKRSDASQSASGNVGAVHTV